MEECTIFTCRDVDLYKIPPRQARGHVSGDWQISDRIFTGTCRVVENSKDGIVSIRLEDSVSGELFALCPIQPGQRGVVVESAVDSSRNFVLRIEDIGTKRHAFVGLNFQDRSSAFDFNVSLTDQERRQRQKLSLSHVNEGKTVRSVSEGTPPAEVQLLYQKNDFTLKEGEKLKLAFKNQTHGNSKKVETSGNFLSRLEKNPGTSGGSGGPNLLQPPESNRSCDASTSGRGSVDEESAKVIASNQKDWATF